MTQLTLIDHKTQIERALLDALRLAFKQRQSVADLAALAALDVSAGEDGALCFVSSVSKVYTLSLFNTSAAASPLLVAPATAPPKYLTAMWVQSQSQVNFGPNSGAPLASKSTGYCKVVDLFAGQGGTDEAMQAVMASKPSLLLLFKSDDLRSASAGYPGSYYENLLRFEVWCFSECDRAAPWSVWGSPVAAELAADPGVNGMVGQVRHLFAGLSGSEADAPRGNLGLPGVQWCDVGAHETLSEDLAQRLYVSLVEVTVRCRFAVPDEDLVAIPPGTINATLTLGDTGAGQTFDRSNYLASGYLVSVGAGLTRTLGTGIAVVGGSPVSSTPGTRTFSANRDTYRDLASDGTVTWVELPTGYPAPPVTTGALRIGVTTTDAGSVVADRLLCSASVAFRSKYQVVP